MLLNLIQATSNLIKASASTVDAENFSHFIDNAIGFAKTTVPLNLQGYEWLARTVSNIIVMSTKLDEGGDKVDVALNTVKLKETFMKHGVYRLAGGIDDMWTDDAYVKNTVKTDSFVIQFTKLGVVNIRS